MGSGISCISLNLFRVDKLSASTRITTRTSGRALLFNSSKMEPSIIKDVCAEVTCLHTSGLRKVAAVALGQTVAVGGGVSVRPTKQGSVSGVLRKPVSFHEDVFERSSADRPAALEGGHVRLEGLVFSDCPALARDRSDPE